MVEKEVVVTSDAGVHARPAMMMVREAMKFSCDIVLVKDEVEADCKSIMSVLGLAIVSGSKLIIKAEGDQAEEAVNIIVKLIESNFSMN